MFSFYAKTQYSPLPPTRAFKQNDITVHSDQNKHSTHTEAKHMKNETKTKLNTIESCQKFHSLELNLATK